MAVPTIDDAPISPWPIRAARVVVVIAAVALWLGACAPMEDRPPPTAAGTAGTNPPSVEPASAPGPIALAPSITGAAAPVPAPVPVPPPPLPLPPPPVPAATVEIPTFAPASCPPGAIAMWSAPDSAGAAVAICRPFHPTR
jgi:hypothetical protein